MQFKKQTIMSIPLSDTETVPFTCHHYISKQHTPELLSSLATGELFQFTHPQTNAVSPVQFPCVYEDSQKQFLVFYNPNQTISNDDFGITLFEDLTDDYSQYTIRVTTTLSDFFEKINVLDYDKLDTEVECVKILTYTLLKEQQPELKDFHLYFYEMENNPVLVILSKDGQTFTEYRNELVTIAHQELQDKLQLQKGELLTVDAKWAINALGLN